MVKIILCVWQRSKNKGLIPYLLKNTQKNRKIVLNEPNAGRDFVNVDDVCEAILLFFKNK